MKVHIEANTNGKGHWTVDEETVFITGLKIGYSSLEYYPEEPFSGELRAYFDPSGFTPGSWNVAGQGLIYTDKLWLKEFKKTGEKLQVNDRPLILYSKTMKPDESLRISGNVDQGVMAKSGLNFLLFCPPTS